MISLKEIHQVVEDAPFGKLTNIQLQLQYSEIVLLTDAVDKMTVILEKMERLFQQLELLAKPKVLMPAPKKVKSSKYSGSSKS